MLQDPLSERLDYARKRRLIFNTIQNVLLSSGVRELPPNFKEIEIKNLPNGSLFWWHDVTKDMVFLMICSEQPDLASFQRSLIISLHSRINADLSSLNIKGQAMSVQSLIGHQGKNFHYMSFSVAPVL